MPLTDDTRVKVREIIARYPQPRSALLPMLHLVQAEEGYVTAEGVALCAEELGITKAEVGAVATFYTMFKRRPTGEYLVSVCTNLSCQILGGDEIYARLSKRLGVGHDQTTEDGTITLEHAECLAACDYAPVVTVNYEFFDNMTEDTAVELVEACRRGEPPVPTRGAPVVSFKEISRQLAGFPDPRTGIERVGRAHPTPAEPVDVRGSESLTGTDVEVPQENADFGVEGGVVERVLTDEEAAATYAGDAPPVDAGEGAAAPKRRSRARSARVPQHAGTLGPRQIDQPDEPQEDERGEKQDATGNKDAAEKKEQDGPPKKTPAKRGASGGTRGKGGR